MHHILHMWLGEMSKSLIKLLDNYISFINVPSRLSNNDIYSQLLLILFLLLIIVMFRLSFLYSRIPLIVKMYKCQNNRWLVTSFSELFV